LRPRRSPLLPRPGSSDRVRARRCSASPWETRWGHARIHDAGPDPGPVRGPAGDRRRGWLKLSPGQVTDEHGYDALRRRGIVGSGRWDLGPSRTRFRRWLSGNPAGRGATCRRGIEDTSERTARSAPRRAGGGKTARRCRVAPVALYTLGTRAPLRLAVESRRISPHHNPLSDAAWACRWKDDPAGPFGAHPRTCGRGGGIVRTAPDFAGKV